MLCSKPWKPIGGSELPCGKCQACRLNKRNIWTTRLLLEQMVHDKSAWITLTYNDKNLPKDEKINKYDVRAWLKALRKAYHPQKIRYYICGEYGDNNNRPHYHAVIYGIGFDYQGLARIDDISKRDNGDYKYPNRVRVMDPDVVKMLRIWKKGNIHFEKPNDRLMSYACEHITKEVNKERHFHSMSQGIGRNAMHAISSWLSTEEGIRYYQEAGDVPAIVRVNKKLRPIGKYLRNIIRRQLYLEEKQTEKAIKKRVITELSPEKKEIKREKDRLKAKAIIELQSQRKNL